MNLIYAEPLYSVFMLSLIFLFPLPYFHLCLFLFLFFSTWSSVSFKELKMTGFFLFVCLLLSDKILILLRWVVLSYISSYEYNIHSYLAIAVSGCCPDFCVLLSCKGLYKKYDIYIMSFIGFPYSKSASLPGYGRNGLHQVGIHLNAFSM